MLWFKLFLGLKFNQFKFDFSLFHIHYPGVSITFEVDAWANQFNPLTPRGSPLMSKIV